MFIELPVLLDGQVAPTLINVGAITDLRSAAPEYATSTYVSVAGRRYVVTQAYSVVRATVVEAASRSYLRSAAHMDFLERHIRRSDDEWWRQDEGPP